MTFSVWIMYLSFLTCWINSSLHIIFLDYHKTRASLGKHLIGLIEINTLYIIITMCGVIVLPFLWYVRNDISQNDTIFWIARNTRCLGVLLLMNFLINFIVVWMKMVVYKIYDKLHTN